MDSSENGLAALGNADKLHCEPVGLSFLRKPGYDTLPDPAVSLLLQPTEQPTKPMCVHSGLYSEFCGAQQSMFQITALNLAENA